MLKILLAIYICISLYVLISTIVGMNEFTKMSGTKHHWFKYFCAILYSITPFLNVYIIYLSKKNRGENNMGINLELYRKAVTSKDRVFTGKYDINGRKINVGDVIVPVGSTEQYCVNYSPTDRCFYGLGTGNKILKQKKFSQCENVGIAIFNEDAKEIFK